MSTPVVISQLIQKFTDSREHFRSNRYNEAQLRREFLDPFFEALGWDVGNQAGYAPQYREVIVEDSLRIEDSAKAPDYAFLIGPQRKFFVEAKKPAVDIKDDIHPAYQLRRYAWNAHLSLSILSDFEELAVYDCRNKPNPGDKAATGRLLLFKYTEYETRWDELAAIFSREAVWKGSFDRYAQEASPKKGTTEVDSEFLKDIETWRDLLARNIALRNPHARSERLLNYAVQMIIDRIIFLRISEDRGLQPQGQLQELANAKSMDGDPLPAEANPRPQVVYPRLLNLFRYADQKYNSGLFHFQAESNNSSSVDAFTPTLTIDDKVLREIIRGLYYPSPYIFKEIPVEILGQVYEQFLGKVIRLTPGGQARVDTKPEVRKAGGVYYTPRYIVDYIVENTVGRLLEGLTPSLASKLRIVDPACGSGSFLLGAYQFLLDWHLKCYLTSDPESYARGRDPALTPATGGTFRLTTTERKRILVNNIYGVDIDAQAVEVTKLSLLLKLLEEETGQLSLGFERVLPDLGQNIQCGNSLIDWDYFTGQLINDQDEVDRVNPFDWRRAFPHVFAQGGFDAVIGNPPYVRQEDLGMAKAYYQQKYEVYAGTADLYSYFIERGVNLLAPGGHFSYIVANKWMRANYGRALRAWLKTKCIDEITDFGDLRVFTSATTYPCILRVSNRQPHFKPWVTTVETLEFGSLQAYVQEHCTTADQTSFEDQGWSLAGEATQALMAKLRQNSIPLDEYVKGKIYYGIKTGLNEAFVIDQATRDRLVAEDPKSADIIKPCLIGKDIKRYGVDWKGLYMIFTKRGTRIKEFPAVHAHLLKYKEKLMPRPRNYLGKDWKGRKPGPYQWFEIQDTVAYYEEFEKHKITWGNLAQKPKFTMDTEGYYINAPGVILPLEDYYLLGILNSSVCYSFISEVAAGRQGGFFEYKPIYVSQMPIHIVNQKDPKEIELANKLAKLVRNRLDLGKRQAQTPLQAQQQKNQIFSLETELDSIVEGLYNIT
jgi:hypothetical protein